MSIRVLLLLVLPVMLWGQVTGPMVRFRTTEGDIDVNLLPNAPQTVANFLKYVNRGAYDNSFVHRSVPGFIWQGGGFIWRNNAPVEIPADPPVRNEFSVSNLRGTLAMAKLGNDPNSATTQWFFNLADNSRNLNTQNGGFTVFGRVANAASLAVMDRIAGLPVQNGVFPSPFDQLPLVNYSGGAVQESNLVRVLGISQIDAQPTGPEITGIISASGFGAFPSAAPGSFIEIYGRNLAGQVARQWAASDFTNGAAPTFLEGVTVTINGQPAFVNYVSSTLVNVQVPANVPADTSVPVVVSYRLQNSPPAQLAIKAVVPGLLAPPNFKVDDKQYVVAVNPATLAYASGGNIPNLPEAPAIPGQTFVFYGIGFGTVTPASVPIAGRIVNELAPLSRTVQFKIGEQDAAVSYAGLAPGIVGLYQFNVIIPPGTPGGDQRVEVIVDGETIAQTLLLPVQAP